VELEGILCFSSSTEILKSIKKKSHSTMEKKKAKMHH